MVGAIPPKGERAVLTRIRPRIVAGQPGWTRLHPAQAATAMSTSPTRALVASGRIASCPSVRSPDVRWRDPVAVAGGILAFLVLLNGAASGADLPGLPPPPSAPAKVLIVTGIDYPGHPWRETAPRLRSILERDPRLGVRIVENPFALADGGLQAWDVVLLHFMDWETPGPGPGARENLRRVVEGGRGLVLTHFACGAWDGDEWPEFRRLVGRVWDPKLRGHDPHGTFRVEIADSEHPITRGMAAFETLDELYTCLRGDVPIRVLARARSRVDGLEYPMAFVLEYGKGRVFHTVLGHDVRAYANDAGVGELLRRGVAWAAGLSPLAASVGP